MAGKVKKIPISMEDVGFIFNNNLHDFHYACSICYCMQCNNNQDSTIINYKISLNDLNDIELQGHCQTCNHKIGRYIETGEDPATAKNSEAIWNTHSALKELKIKKEK
jgi:hypothetical protein